MEKKKEKSLPNSSRKTLIRDVPSSGKKRTSATAMAESIFACKWSARVITLINQGVRRPGAITRSLDGLTTKVLNDCLRRMVQFGLIERTSYPEIPPRVEYKLTPLGERFVPIITAVEDLQREINAGDSD